MIALPAGSNPGTPKAPPHWSAAVIQNLTKDVATKEETIKARWVDCMQRLAVAYISQRCLMGRGNN